MNYIGYSVAILALYLCTFSVLVIPGRKRTVITNRLGPVVTDWPRGLATCEYADDGPSGSMRFLTFSGRVFFPQLLFTAFG